MTDVILRISGMDCGACAVRIVRALQGLPGLREVSVSDTAGCARLTYDEMAVDLGEIARRVQRAGFDVPVGTAELRCPGADAGAEARLRAVFGVRSVARAGDTFTVTLWPVGTDTGALPAVLGPDAELTAQRGGDATVLQRTIAALQRAQTVRTPEREWLERAASRMTALLIILAAGVGAVWLFRRQPGDLTRALTCACGVLAAACPGAAGQAAGVAALAGIGRAAERGELLMHGAEASAAQTACTVRRCGWLLLVYHAVCLPLAACGVIGPAAAAVLACGASGGVLLYALRRKETKGERP